MHGTVSIFSGAEMKLELENTDPRKDRITLTVFPVIIGLDRDADVCLDDSSIGHYQCMIDQSDGELMVWDLGTKLGTWVNGVRVSRKSVLEPGDQLTIGRSTFIVHYPTERARSARRTTAARKPRPASSKADLVEAAE